LHQLRSEIYRTWDAVQFLLDIAHERAKVAERVQLSLYAVEPNLKDGSGALRDIHIAGWVAAVMLKTENPLAELEWRGLMTSAQAEQLRAARDFFLALRVWLHLETGKKNDVLRVEYQDRCSLSFGYQGEGALSSQKLLADYYSHAENVSRALDDVMRRLLQGPLPLDSHFVAVARRLRAAHPHALQNHPELLIAPFALSQKYGFDFDDELEEQLVNAAPLVDDADRRHAIMRASFTLLLRDPASCAASLTAMRKRGALQAVLPEFAQMLHLAPPDPSHQLTVGEHSIYAVDQLGQLWQERVTNEELFNVWNGVDDIEVLLLATLLHDVGKIDPSREHCVAGEELALEITRRLQWNEDRCLMVAALVRWHLILPRLGRLRDLAAPATVREVMENVNDVAMLKMLYLLSLADTKAVGERTYSELDLQNMKELYERTLMAVTREEAAQVLTDSEKREQMVARQRKRLHNEMRRTMKNRIDESTLLRLSQQLPTAYVLNTPLPTIGSHLQLVDQLPQEKLLVDWQDSNDGTVTEMTIVTYDEPAPGLLSKICGVVYSVGAEILEASAFTLHFPASSDVADATENHVVLDRLQLGVRGKALPETRCVRFADKLRAVLTEGESLEKVLSAAGKAVAASLQPERLEARNDLSDEHTVITVVNDNVPGLMFWVTRALATLGIDIHTAKVTTWAGLAEDVFYVTKRALSSLEQTNSGKIPEAELQSTLAALRKLLEDES
jgi:[protein-PII] uridylyltransferase